MHDARAVRVVDTRAELPDDFEGAFERERTARLELRREIPPVEELHDEERKTALGRVDVDDADDVTAVQSRDDARFALETRDESGLTEDLGAQNFDRDPRFEPRLLRVVHHAHGAFAEHAAKQVAPREQAPFLGERGRPGGHHLTIPGWPGRSENAREAVRNALLPAVGLTGVASTFRYSSMLRDGSDSKEFTDRELVRALRALADPTRFRMVQEVASRGELSCGQLTEQFDISQPTISHHLKILADAGILIKRTEGKHHFTSVNHALLGRVSQLLVARLSPNASLSGAKRSERTNPSR